MKKILYLLMSCIFVGQGNLFAQEILKGKVIATDTSLPLKGASVSISNTTVKAQTDEFGEFNFKVKEGNYILKITYLGYETYTESIKVPYQGNLVVKMQPSAQQLEEVIVNTGYQSLKREQVVGSVTTLTSSRLEEQKGANLLSRLENITSGLIADRSTGLANGKLMIRGLSTIRGGTDVLIIVDNFPYEGDLDNLNPNDVESITVLKDGVAASIWGTRAGNGVIVITTKKGTYNQPLQVDFSANSSIKEKTDLSNIPEISSSDFIDTEMLLYGKGYYTSQINSTSKPALSPVIELLVKQTAGTISAAQAQQGIDAFRNIDVRDQYEKYFYQNGHSQQYALQLKAGTSNNNWIFALGYDRNLSELAATSNRLNVKFYNTLRPVKNLEIGIGLSLTESNTASGKPAYGSITSKNGAIYPYARFADANGEPIAVVKDYRQSYIETAGAGKLLNWQYFPLTDYQTVDQTNKLQEIRMNVGVNYKFLSAFNFDVKYQYQKQSTDGNTNSSIENYAVRDAINRFTSINATSGAVTNRIPIGGFLDLSKEALVADNLRAQLGFDKTFGQHQFNAIVGSEVRELSTNTNSSRLYGYNDNIFTIASVDYVTPYPNFITGSNSNILDYTNLSGTNNRFVSVYGNVSYTFQDKYTLFASGRRDASNLFGVNTNDKWNLLWSVGGAWEISKEKFYKNEAIPFLKLRAGYGLSGNIDPNMAAVTTILYSGSVSIYSQTPTARVNNYLNPELKWEKVKMLNIGADFSTKNNRINGTIEYFNKRTDDLFGTYPVDYTTGIGASVIKNVASTVGNGVDLSLNTVNTKGKIQWSTNLNLSYYR